MTLYIVIIVLDIIFIYVYFFKLKLPSLLIHHPRPSPPFKKKYYTAIFVLQNNSNLFITYSFLQQIMITITCTWLKTKIYFKKVNVKNTTLC